MEEVNEAVEDYCKEYMVMVDRIVKHGEKYNEEVDEPLLTILEASFLMLFHEREAPLELIETLFGEYPEYYERMLNIVIGSSLEDSVEKTGEVIEIKNDDGSHEGFMLKSDYEKIIGTK